MSKKASQFKLVLQVDVGNRLAWLVLVLLFFLPDGNATFSNDIRIVGKVVGVTDSDTIRVLMDRRPVKVRLSCIDTEKRQPYDSRAKQALSDLVSGWMAAVDVKTTDRYGRTVGRAYWDGLDVNAEMVRRGAAWVYRKFCRDASLLELEAQARTERWGLWGLPEAQRVLP